MALQDLTPQLRTRLSRMERAVGWFVMLAVALLAFGFVYYVYTTAERKGWFKTKAPFFTFTESATGLKVGDPVTLMGRAVGHITEIQTMGPDDPYNIYVEFALIDPYYGYMWTKGSRAKVAPADFLGKRSLEVTKGTGGYAVYGFWPLRRLSLAEAQNLAEPEKWKLGEEVYDGSGTNLVVAALQPLTKSNLTVMAGVGVKQISLFDTRETRKSMTAVWNYQEGRYDPYNRKTTKPFWLESDETPALTERLEQLVGQVEKALPNILSLTNPLGLALSNSVSLTSNLNLVAVSAQPAVSNLAAATAHLDRPGALGEWLLPTNVQQQLEGTLGNASATLASANTNLASLAQNLSRSLDHLADLTSNLNSQVQVNTNLLSAISQTVIHADEFVQGLKRHWLLRSAFKAQTTNAPPSGAPPSLRSPKAKGAE